jgi:hypothetical protein
MTFTETLAQNKIRLFIGNFLSIVLFKNEFFELDLWMFVHLLTGGLIMFILRVSKLKFKWRWGIFLTLIIGFEIIEFFLYTNLTTLFIPESPVNVIWDLIFGIVGAGIVDLIFVIRNLMKR